MLNAQEWEARLSNYPDVHEEAQRRWSGDRVMGEVLAKFVKFARAFLRFFGFLALCGAALAEFAWKKCHSRSLSYSERALWAHRWARRFLTCLHIEATYAGASPKNGVLAANHLSYLDIVVLLAERPLIFVSKKEVARWPLIGWLVRCAGTIFVDRELKSDVTSVAAAFAPVIAEKIVVVIFPEGTSTGGDRVLPFMSSLFEPAAANHWPVSAACINYSLIAGSVSDEVCYWREMTFLPHFLNLLTKPSIKTQVTYENTIPNGLNRKQMARVLHDQVQGLLVPAC